MKEWLSKLADALKRLAKWTVVEALPVILENVFGAIFSFLDKIVVFVAENTWALIVFLYRFIGVWLKQKVKK